MEDLKTFIKGNRIVDPRLIALVTDMSAKLMEQNLCDSKRTDLVIESLKITSRSCHDLASKTKTSFREEEDLKLFRQNLMALAFILETAFSNEWFTNISKNVIDWSNGLNHNEKMWDTLKYKAIRQLSLDLIVELFVLFDQLNNAYLSAIAKDYLAPRPSNFIFYIKFIKVSSLSHDYFKFRISQIEKIINAGLEKPIEKHEAYKEYNCSKYTKKVLAINQLRRNSLVGFYNQTCQACFEDELFSVTRELLDWERVQSICNLANLTPLAHKSELDSNLL